MKLAYFVKKSYLKDAPEFMGMLRGLKDAGHEIYALTSPEDLPEGTDAVMAVGGDGTFLIVASMVAGRGVPVLGVNWGRLGFLSENRPEDIVSILESGCFHIEERDMLQAVVRVPSSEDPVQLPGGNLALNEISLLRSGAGMIGVDVDVDEVTLPTYWADGLLVSTASGSTAYNLAAGGPICLPEVRAHIVTPVSPHNLNVRPLLVPSSSVLELRCREARKTGSVLLSLDNRSFNVPVGTKVEVRKAPSATLVMRSDKSHFIGALEDKLFWGEDKRNTDR